MPGGGGGGSGGGVGGGDGGVGVGVGVVVQWVLSYCVQEVASVRDIAPRGRYCWVRYTRASRACEGARRVEAKLLGRRGCVALCVNQRKWCRAERPA